MHSARGSCVLLRQSALRRCAARSSLGCRAEHNKALDVALEPPEAGPPATPPSRHVPGVFPWRESPAPPPSILGQLRSGYLFQKYYGRAEGLTSWETLQYSIRDLPDGARSAFLAVLAAVFELDPNRLLAPPATTQKEDQPAPSKEESAVGHGDKDGPAETPVDSAETPAEEPRPDLVHPAMVMETKLADFYLAAMAASRKDNLLVQYKLYRVRQVSTVKNAQVYLGVTRWSPKTQDTWHNHFLGRIIYPLPKSIDEAIEKEMRGVQDSDRRAAHKLYDYLEKLRELDGVSGTLQVDVDVSCDELFCVKDRETMKVLQGSDAVARRTHRLRLEMPVRFGDIPSSEEDRPYFRWVVADIDAWLEGNPLVKVEPDRRSR